MLLYNGLLVMFTKMLFMSVLQWSNRFWQNVHHDRYVQWPSVHSRGNNALFPGSLEELLGYSKGANLSLTI